jgi:TolB-like protein
MSGGAYLFEDFSLDPDRRELRRAGEAVAIGPQVFDLLHHLVRHRDRVVTKDDMVEAVWGGRIVSDSTLTSHVNAVRKALGDTGKEQRLVRTVPRKGVRFVGEVRNPAAALPPAAAVVPADAALPLPDKASIAVLPFQNLSGDPERDYFCQGLAEEIITALSRFRLLFVIARNSSFNYESRPVDVRRVGLELGVRYVLDGSVRWAGASIRCAVQLIDAPANGHLWAERYDGPAEDLLHLQDRIAEAVVGVIEPTIQRAEIERVRGKRPEHLGAYDLYWRGLALLQARTRESTAAALEAAHQAIALDPSFGPGYALALRTHIHRYVQGWEADEQETARAALDLVARGLRSDPFEPGLLAISGHCFAMLGRDFDKAIACVEQAMTINPNQANVCVLSGYVHGRVGDTRTAIDHFQRALRLSPRDRQSHAIFAALAHCHLVEGDAETAWQWANRALQYESTYRPGWSSLAAAAAATGRLSQAKAAVARLLELDPRFSISRWVRRSAKSAAEVAVVVEALRRAGLPED